jgi:hypothetical protein
MSMQEIIVMCVGTVIAALALLYATCKVRSVLKAELDSNKLNKVDTLP